jgi:DNA polymerase
VDAKQQLRRYLEQRRELGESEFVLDGVTVDEALRALGATGASGGPADWRSTLAKAEVAPSEDVREAEYQSLEEVAAAIRACTRCGLYKTATNAVPGDGNPHAEFVCVGEAPGAEEDRTGKPFVGPAGELLTKILAAIDLTREDVFICNVLKHRPPGNRNPSPDEVAACKPYLLREIAAVKPEVIVVLGNTAMKNLLGTREGITRLRGTFQDYNGIRVMPTFHPAYLLRDPSKKRETWEDLKKVRDYLDNP